MKINKKNLYIITVILAIIVIGLYGCSKGKGVSAQTTVRIGYLNIVASLPLFVAEEKGFLKEEGVTFETFPIASSNQLVDGIIAGNLDFFIESSAVPILAVEIQSPGKLKVFSVSEITPKAPFDALLVKENSSIKSLSDLAGKKIGVFPGSTAANILKKYLIDKGIDVSGITFIPMPPQNHLTALLEGSVDVIHAYEPTTSFALTKGGVRHLYGSIYADMISPNPQGVAAVGTSFIAKNPEIANKVIRAFERAMIFMKEHDTETRQILAKRMNLPDAVAKRCVFLYMIPHKEINIPIFQRYADMLIDIGEISSHIKVDNLIYLE